MTLKAYIFKMQSTTRNGKQYHNGTTYVVMANYALDAWRVFRKDFPDANRIKWAVIKANERKVYKI